MTASEASSGPVRTTGLRVVAVCTLASAVSPFYRNAHVVVAPDGRLARVTGFLDAGRAETSVELPGITALSLAGGVNELLYTEILHGATSQLPSRLPDLMFWIALPFLGPEQAAEGRERTRLSMLES